MTKDSFKNRRTKLNRNLYYTRINYDIFQLYTFCRFAWFYFTISLFCRTFIRIISKYFTVSYYTDEIFYFISFFFLFIIKFNTYYVILYISLAIIDFNNIFNLLILLNTCILSLNECNAF